ncbi:hypothetical protein KAR91_06445, partial [Candidatus Pacearchaeota archaeon]|nr:hypothetical protein [Candidatus Pacearchaeota archaeon]
SLATYVNSRSALIVAPGDTPPLDPGVLPLGSITIGAPGGPSVDGISVAIENPNTADVACSIEISRAFNASRRRFKGPFKSADTQFVTLGGLAITNTEFLTLNPGSRYFVRIRALSEAEPIIISNVYFSNGLAVAIGP